MGAAEAKGHGIRLRTETGERGAAGLRYLPLNRRVGGSADPGSDQGVREAFPGGLPRSAAGPAPRPPPVWRKGRGYGGLPQGRGGHTGVDPGGRGGHRYTQCHGHDDRGGGPVRPLPVAPVPRPGGAGTGQELLPSSGGEAVPGGKGTVVTDGGYKRRVCPGRRGPAPQGARRVLRHPSERSPGPPDGPALRQRPAGAGKEGGGGAFRPGP